MAARCPNAALISLSSPCRLPLRTVPRPSQVRHAASLTPQRMRGRMKQRVEGSKGVPDDVGLITPPFIMPSKPSLFKSPGVRLQLYRQRLISLWLNFRYMLAWKYGHGIKPVPKFKFFETHREARKLHRKMFDAIALCEPQLLRGACGDGLTKDIATRIMLRRTIARDKTTSLSYQLHKYRGLFPFRVVASAATQIPGMNLIIRQHVVRVNSVQSVRKVRKKVPDNATTTYATSSEGKKTAKFVVGNMKFDRESREELERGLGFVTLNEGRGGWVFEEEDGEQARQAAKKKNVTEYVVLQKRILNEEEGPWLIWGTVQETDAEEFLKRRSEQTGKKTLKIEVPSSVQQA